MLEKLEQDMERSFEYHLDSFIEDAFQRLQSAPEDHACALHQESLQAVIAAMRFATARILADKVTEFGSIPFGVVDDLLNLVCERALICGARMFASLTRKPEDTPAKDPVGFTEIWQAAHEALELPDSDHGKAFISAINQVGPIPAVLASATFSTLKSHLELAPAFSAHEDEIGEIMFDNMLRGVAVESCYVRLMAEQREDKSWFRNIAAAITGNPDLEDPDNLATLNAIIGVPDSYLPWPTDLQCFCGVSLRRSMFCCDPDKPIDLKGHLEELDFEFVLRRQCCGKTLNAFRCDACSRVYSWHKGVVGTVTGYSHM